MVTVPIMQNVKLAVQKTSISLTSLERTENISNQKSFLKKIKMRIRRELNGSLFLAKFFGSYLSVLILEAL